MSRGPWLERFRAKIHITDGCWLWTAYRDRKGYGRFGIAERGMLGAHRLSYELHVGPIPDGLWVLHRCDNRACVRPDHLFLGTHADNMRDMKEKGRARNPYMGMTHCLKGHPLTEGNYYPYRGNARQCKTCHKEYGVRSNERRTMRAREAAHPTRRHGRVR